MAAEADHGSGGTKVSHQAFGPIEPASRRVLNAHAVAFDRLSRHVSQIDPRQNDPPAQKRMQ